MRAFAALIPPEPVRLHADGATMPLRGASLRWVPEENLHITLAFYGEVPDGAAGDLAEEVAATAALHPPPRLHLRGAGSVRNRVLWLGVGGQTQSLAGFSQEPHRPHLTVARAGRRSAGVDLAPLVQVLSVYSGPSWQPDRIGLFASHLGEGRGGAPRYEALAWVDFGKPQDSGQPSDTA